MVMDKDLAHFLDQSIPTYRVKKILRIVTSVTARDIQALSPNQEIAIEVG